MEIDSIIPFWAIIFPVVSLIIFGTIIGLIFWLIHKKQKEKENKKKEEKERYQQIYGKGNDENYLGKNVPKSLVVKKKNVYSGNRRIRQDPDQGKREKQGERYKDEEDGKENSDENVAQNGRKR